MPECHSLHAYKITFTQVPVVDLLLLRATVWVGTAVCAGPQAATTALLILHTVITLWGYEVR